MLKKIICTVLSAVLMIFGTVCAAATSKNDFSLQKVDEYFSLMNGCSRISLENYSDEAVVDAIAYCGLDLNSPRIMFFLSVFYFTNNIDTAKITSDPEYSTQIISSLDGYLSEKGIANSRSGEFIKKYQGEISQSKLSFSTVGAYTFRAKKSGVEKMLDDSCVDFIIVGTGFMLKQGDVNADGRIDLKDVKSMQSLTAELIKTENTEEKKFFAFAGDLNGDGRVNINDATSLQQKLTA